MDVIERLESEALGTTMTRAFEVRSILLQRSMQEFRRSPDRGIPGAGSNL
jgi:hypothetical protein